MSFTNLEKIAVSIKQLEDNIQRAKDKGLIHTGKPTDTHTPLTDKAFDSLPQRVKNRLRIRYGVDNLVDRGYHSPAGFMGSHTSPSMKKHIKHGGEVAKFVAQETLAPAPRDVKPISLIPRAISDGISKLRGRSGSDLLDRAALALSPSARKEVDDAKSMLAKKRLQEPAKIFLNPDRDEKDFFLNIGEKMSKLDDDTRRGLHPLIANHELNETNMKKFKHGNEFASVQGHGHYGLHGIHDVSTVNTMNESSNAQKIFRDLRKNEIEDAIKTSPALKRVLEPMSEGQKGFENRISQQASNLAKEHAEHNQKVLSRVPERLHNHPAVQARLKTVDSGELASLAEKNVRKSGRLNRHMLKHVGNVLDKAVKHKVPERLRQLKLEAAVTRRF